jgi:hypothetical protein
MNKDTLVGYEFYSDDGGVNEFIWKDDLESLKSFKRAIINFEETGSNDAKIYELHRKEFKG